MDYDLRPVLAIYGAVFLGVCIFWGFVGWLAWRLVDWLTAG